MNLWPRRIITGLGLLLIIALIVWGIVAAVRAIAGAFSAAPAPQSTPQSVVQPGAPDASGSTPPRGQEATAAGLLTAPASVAVLYLWLSGPASMSALDLVGAFAELGIVVAPGDFYGEAGAERIRMSLTGTDERVAAACERLRSARARELFT